MYFSFEFMWMHQTQEFPGAVWSLLRSLPEDCWRLCKTVRQLRRRSDSKGAPQPESLPKPRHPASRMRDSNPGSRSCTGQAQQHDEYETDRQQDGVAEPQAPVLQVGHE